MSEHFLKFKRRLGAFRIIRSFLIALSVGLVAGGVWLMLIRLALLNLMPFTAIIAGVGALAIAFGLAFLLGGRSDKSFAAELDELFGLNARVQTMVEYIGESGEMILMQRKDADRALSEIPVKSYKFKGLWIYIVALVVSVAVLVSGFFVPDMRDYTPPVEVIPFELSEYQERSLTQLIDEVEGSDMEEEFKAVLVQELRNLLAELKEIDLYDDMALAVMKSMNTIADVTYESSTATEMLNAVWDSGDKNFRYLAKSLATVLWENPQLDWTVFAESMTEYSAILMGDNIEDENAIVGAERAKEAIGSMMAALDVVLTSSKLDETDEMYLALKNMFADEALGLALIRESEEALTDDQVRAMIVKGLGVAYDAVLLNRTNFDEGERVMARLEMLFLIRAPKFERPEFFKNNLLVDGSVDNSGNNDNSSTDEEKPGGAGGGTVYGSDDLVLDPLTGKLVKYGDLIKKYNELMYERLEGDFYTEEQKQAIKKYFELLYGINKEEGK